jgi:putative membrane protein
VSAARALLGALVAAQVAHGRRPQPVRPAETRAILLLMLAASAAEAREARGRRGTAFLGVAGAVGLAAEVAGVATGRPFGRYAYSAKLGRRVVGVPPLAGAAWALMARPAWVAAGHVTRSRLRRVPVAAAALAAWDVFLDPRMVADGYWTWEAGGRFAGVPASNFAGWFGTGLALFAVAAPLDGGAPDQRDDGALAIYAWTWVGETIANAALWGRPRVAAAGCAAMGAVAAPALARRLR